MEKKIVQMSSHLDGAFMENKNQMRLVRSEMIGVFMEGLHKNFRSRCRDVGSQTDLSMCDLITVSNMYGVQEHPLSEDAILRFYKHPFLQFLSKSNTKPK